jgi:hypothetical protein
LEGAEPAVLFDNREAYALARTEQETQMMPSGGAPVALDCGTQVRLPGERKRVGPGVAATETFRQKEVQRFDADYLLKVREHSAGRNRSVSQLLAIFSFMRNYGAIPATARVDWDRAHVQSIRGDPTSDAAHNLPCQILIDGQFPWLLVSGKEIDGPRIIEELRALFGGVYVAPKVLNVADSIAETSCLRGALVTACAQVIAKSKLIGREAGVLKRGVGLNYGDIELAASDVSNPGAGIDTVAVAGAVRTWLTASKAAFGRAIEYVNANGASSMGQDVTDDVIYVLERYARATHEWAAPVNAALSQMEQGFWLAKR